MAGEFNLGIFDGKSSSGCCGLCSDFSGRRNRFRNGLHSLAKSASALLKFRSATMPRGL